MKIAYFDCFSGVSGDMLIGSLLDAGIEWAVFENELQKIPVDGFAVSAAKVLKKHLSATKFDVEETKQQVFRSLKDLNRVVEKSALDAQVCKTARAIFLKIAEAEARVHHQPVDKVHFHEIGAVDTIIDVMGTLLCLRLLNIERVVSSPLNVGSGFVTFSHGKYPVPAPATAEILKSVPIYSTESKGELVTPTGAAIISTVADAFGPMPHMTVSSVGYGAGSRDLEQPNVLRVFVGDSHGGEDVGSDVVCVIETNIDDMNPQWFDFVLEKLFDRGALDVYFTPVIMKKTRPGVHVTVLCEPRLEAQMCDILFRETTTLGVRIREERRQKLQRKIVAVETALGTVRVKISERNGEIMNRTPEYEDCKRVAKEKGLPLKRVYELLAAELQSANARKAEREKS